MNVPLSMDHPRSDKACKTSACIVGYFNPSLAESVGKHALLFAPFPTLSFFPFKCKRLYDPSRHLVAGGHDGVVLRLCATLQNLQRNQNCVLRGNNFYDEMLPT